MKLTKIEVMSRAFAVVEVMVDSGKITQAQYLESLEDIRNSLDINDAEFEDSLALGWESPADLNVN